MTSIEQVIARSRQPGEFSERKRFSVARKRGIEKMRKFALADPHLYILELIACAVSAGAEYLDIEVEAQRCVASFVGGRLLEHELAQLFDFLFASKDRLEIGHIRSLALGLNAAMLFSPQRIVVESGDGTLAGTTRMVIHGGSDEVEIGRPTRSLGGTYIALEGLSRRGARWLSLGEKETPREQHVIESRCLAAPIPIIVNGNPLFGFSAQRTPGLYGYGSVLSFDKGDLYGTIGKDASFPNPSFRLLTAGVAIESKRHALVPGHSLGGIVCFDRLRKTADHSGIVEDDRLEELWLRLEPYARQLVSGSASQSHDAAHLDGTPIPLHELRALLHRWERVVIVPPDIESHGPRAQRSESIGKLLNAPVLRLSSDRVASLRILGGGKLRVFRPELDSDLDLDVLCRPMADAPSRPWLATPVDSDPLSSRALVTRLLGVDADSERDDVRALVERFGPEDIRCTVYSPTETPADAGTTSVRLVVSDRVAWEGNVPAVCPGHVIDVHLGDISPSLLLRPYDDGEEPLAFELASVISRHAAEAASTAFSRKLDAVLRRPLEPDSTLAKTALAAISRAVTPVLREHEGRPAVEFIQVQALELDLLGLPIFRTLDGRSLDLRGLARSMNECHGLVYGVVPTSPPDLAGLDRTKILELDEDREQLLVGLVGDGSYVRVDRRDVLARSGGVSCRDVALGLRDYPDWPVLVEGDDLPDELSSVRACIRDLVDQLIARVRAASSEPVGDSHAFSEVLEHRRQACRQLQYFITHADPELIDACDSSALLGLRLFVDDQGSPCDFAQLREAFDREGLIVFHGHTMGEARLNGSSAASDRRAPPRPIEGLTAPPFLHHLLARFPKVRPAFDFDLRPRGPSSPSSLLVETDFRNGGVRGRLGVPFEAVRHPDIVLLLPDRERARALTGLAREYGVVGWLEFDPGAPWDDGSLEGLVPAIDEAARRLLRGLLTRLGEYEHDPRFERSIDVLLEHASQRLVLSRRFDGTVEPSVNSELAAAVLGLPVFFRTNGTAASGHALVRRFCSLVERDIQDPGSVLASELSPDLGAPQTRWIQKTLRRGNVIEHPRRSAAMRENEMRVHAGPISPMVLAVTLGHWLDRLRPDPRQPPTRVHVSARNSTSFVEGANEVVYIELHHRLTTWILQTLEQDPSMLAWPLLSIYAHLNAMLDPVTNEHEQQFQRAVARAVDLGRLHLVEPPQPSAPASGADPRKVRT